MVRIRLQRLVHVRHAALQRLLVAGEARGEESPDRLVEALRLIGHGWSGQQEAQQQRNEA